MKKQILFIALMLVQIFCGAAMASAQEKYQVGDFYCDDDVMGVVFWVDESGEHGKIVSIVESPRVPWAGGLNQDTLIGAFDKTDGIANKLRVDIKGGCHMFSPFAWCEELGDRWYLPAVDELSLLLSKEVIEKVNSQLEELYQLAGEPIVRGYDADGAVRWYWSSTEPTDQGDIPCFAYAVLASGGMVKALDKGGYKCYVRAIAKF